MLRVFAALWLFSGASALVCPYGGAGLYTDGNDGSCYSDITTGYSRLDYQLQCSSSNAYLPFVSNAFQNSVLQQKTMNVTVNRKHPPGIWLGLTCTGNAATSCSWDDGTPVTSSSYSNFDKGFPNATIGSCVYQDITTGLWRSEVCYPRYDLAAYCKFTPTNNGTWCTFKGETRLPSYIDHEYYFNGNCYVLYYSKDSPKTLDNAENICAQDCGHVVSIHSEGENSFVRDLFLALKGDEYATYPANGYLGLKTGDSQWLDGTPVDYTKYGSSTSGPCSYLAANSSQIPRGSWYRDNCNPSHYLICKKPLLNTCDTPYNPFPTNVPVICNGPKYLPISGSLRSPGYPYYPYGQQPNHCEYIQKLNEVLNPTMTLSNVILADFPPVSNISHFEFYSSEDPNEEPFFRVNGSGHYDYSLITVTSPTNILRAVYTTVGNPHYTEDWGKLEYSAEQQLHCTFVEDYGYLGYYNQTASETYFQENHMVQYTTELLLDVYNTFSCQLKFSWNSAAYGNVGRSFAFPSPVNYTNTIQPYIPSNGDNFVDLCSFIDILNSVQMPPGTENSCLVFFSGRSAQDFSACKPVDTKKFRYTFGVAIDGATGVSTLTSNVVNVTDSFFAQDLMKMMVKTIRPAACSL